MTKDLVISQEMALTPAEVVEGATTQAKLLMDIVEKTGCFQLISGKKYLQVEAWETIGAFNRTHAETEAVTPIVKDDITIGYEAHVQLWKDGIIAGGAFMPCYFSENCCKGKDGDAKHKSAMSAAQTFATSKAYRMNFSYVAILAGYQPLPAEEITSDMVDKTEHWCTIHDIAFFKRGRMKWYAHKIEGTDKWCPEELDKKNQAPKAEVAPKTEPEAPPEQEQEKPVQQPTKSTSEASGEDLSSMVFKDAGALKNYMKDGLGMSTAQIGAATAGHSLTTAEGLAECWASILETRGKPDEESTTQAERLFE